MKYLKQICIVTMLLLLCSCSSSLTQGAASTAEDQSPSEVVEQYLLSSKSEDGVISLVVDEVFETDKTTYVEMMKGSDAWNENGWSEENIAVVTAYYQAEYDGTKLPLASGKLMQEFYLTRENESSPWTIWDYMSPADYEY